MVLPRPRSRFFKQKPDAFKHHVLEPKRLIENRSKIGVIAQDATPVYLDCSTGKILIDAANLDDVNRRRLQKRLRGAGVACSRVEVMVTSAKPSDAAGSSRREKNRLTLLMRQGLSGLFDVTASRIEGHILDAVFLVQAAKHAQCNA